MTRVDDGYCVNRLHQSNESAGTNSSNNGAVPMSSTTENGGAAESTTTPTRPTNPFASPDVGSNEGRNEMPASSSPPIILSSPSSATPSYASVGTVPLPTPSSATATSDAVEGRHTIDSRATFLRKDSDDASISKILPVHNFFSQQFSAYDSDGSDGSLVFSPGPTDDINNRGSAAKAAVAAIGSRTPIKSSMRNNSGEKQASNVSSSAARDRFPSVDSVASNGSIRYLPPTPHSPLDIADGATGSNSISQQPQQQMPLSGPINPQMLPYHERRKLMQQRQEQQQQQHQEAMLYHAAVVQAHQVATAQAQQHLATQQQPPTLSQANPTPYPIYAYPVDPQMAAAYYQMYGMPPPPGLYHPALQHFLHPSSTGSNGGYQSPPHLEEGYGHYKTAIPPMSSPPHQMHPTMHPQHQISGLDNMLQQQQLHLQEHLQPYPFPQIPIGPDPMPLCLSYHDPHPMPTPPSYAFVPAPQPPPRQQRQKQRSMAGVQKLKQPTQTPQPLASVGQHPERPRKSVVATTGSTPISSTSGVASNIGSNKNPPRPPSGPPVKPSSRASVVVDTPDFGVACSVTGRRSGGGGVHRESFASDGSSNTPPPPPPPQGHAPTPSVGSLHMRADSSGSMSSLCSRGPSGLGSGGGPCDGLTSSSSMGNEKDQSKQRHSHANDQRYLSIDRKESPPSPPAPPSPKGRYVDRNTSINEIVVTTPETPRNVVSHGRKNSFLDMLRLGWSPQSRNSPSSTVRKQPDVDEFHRRNREFLQRATAVPNDAIRPQVSAAPVPSREHRRLGSQDRPPASRGTHQRLQSISNDEWNDDEPEEGTSSKETKRPAIHSVGAGRNKEKSARLGPGAIRSSTSEETSESGSLIDDESDDIYWDENVSEQTSLLPPSGISSSEQEEKDSRYGSSSSRRTHHNYTGAGGSQRHSQQRPSSIEQGSSRNGSSSSVGDAGRTASKMISSGSRNTDTDISMLTDRWDNRTQSTLRKARKKKYRRKNQKGRMSGDSSDSSEDSSDSDTDYRQWTKKRARMFEKERMKRIEQWKAEARSEAATSRKKEESDQWHRQIWTTVFTEFQKLGSKTFRGLTLAEAFIGNLPLTVGAVAMAIVTLGVVWFKLAEEYLDTCEPVHFHSSQCTFPEFPGCFYCDTDAKMYKVAIGFHYLCTVISGLLAMLVVAKILLATRVVIDEMSSPTTSSPAGLLCMTSALVFAGRGLIGQVIVSVAACVHLGLAIWFIYMALAYHIMPEPSWFPNTVGIGLSAVKTWLYYPMPGHLLMAISLSLNFFFFPISLIRVATNKKISATVAWMQMSAPAVSLYSLTIMAQPSFEEEYPDITNFQRVHRLVYLPCMHVMCALSLLGMAASLFSLWVRWPDFSRKEFSPAHAAFCFPTLSHANAIQAYRGALRSFSGIPPRTWRMYVLDAYWLAVLLGGTIATIWICGRFIYKLPEWTSPDVTDEDEPPAPYDTLLSRQRMVTAGDHLTQPFVSPAILQANETGALILLRSARDGSLRYVRTRRIRAFGFEPTMNWSEMQHEREVLLEWVGKHPPRRRHRTLSVPGIDFSYGASLPSFGTENTGQYGSFSPVSSSRRRSLSQADQPSVPL